VSTRTAVLVALAPLVGCDESQLDSVDSADMDQFMIHGGSLPNAPHHDAVFSISTFNLPKQNYFCSGVLIAPDVVMTAAHCLDEAGFGAAFNTVETGDIKVGFGPRAGKATYYQVSKVEIEPGYDRLSFGVNDVGLIRTKKDMEVENGITAVPALPASEALDAANDIGATINLAGFGENNTVHVAGAKLQIDLTIDSIFGQNFDYDTSGGGTCFGDSGGPAFIDRNGTIYVAGTTSYGINIVPDCSGPNSVGVSMAVDQFEAFIAGF
jgi:V8-like Glu-specific endopeptidase